MLLAFQGVPHTKEESGSAPWVKEHTRSSTNVWSMIPAAQLCYIACDRHSSTRQEPAGALSECWCTTQKAFWKHSEIFAIFGHWKSRKRDQTLVPERYFGCRCFKGHSLALPKPRESHQRAQGVPGTRARPARRVGRSAPLRVSHTDTRHSDRESSVATTITIPQPPRRGGVEARWDLGRLGSSARRLPP